MSREYITALVVNPPHHRISNAVLDLIKGTHNTFSLGMSKARPTHIKENQLSY